MSDIGSDREFCVQFFVTPWTVAHQSSLSFTISWSLLKLMSIESVMPSNHLILCHYLLLLPSIFSNIRVFFSDSVFHIKWPKSWSFSISNYNEYPGLISFRTDWFDILTVQGTLKSILQHHSLKESIYGATLTSIHDYWKNLSLTTGTIVGKVMCLLFNTLSRLVPAFLPRSPRLLISWLQSQSVVILEPKKIKSIMVSIFSHLFAMKWWDPIYWF